MNPRRIIIPAAGNAVRFGGILKELLPISETECALSYAVKTAGMFGTPVVITNASKEPFQRKALARAGAPLVEFIEQADYAHDLWSAIQCGLQAGCAGGLILADTVAEFELQVPLKGHNQLVFGCFETTEPSRFSIVLETARIATKEANPPGNKAWGMVFWHEQVTEYLLELHARKHVAHYDRAFEAAMAQFEWGVFPLKAYADLGTFAAYRDFILSTSPKKNL